LSFGRLPVFWANDFADGGVSLSDRDSEPAIRAVRVQSGFNRRHDGCGRVTSIFPVLSVFRVADHVRYIITDVYGHTTLVASFVIVRYDLCSRCLAVLRRAHTLLTHSLEEEFHPTVRANISFVNFLHGKLFGGRPVIPIFTVARVAYDVGQMGLVTYDFAFGAYRNFDAALSTPFLSSGH